MCIITGYMPWTVSSYPSTPSTKRKDAKRKLGRVPICTSAMFYKTSGAVGSFRILRCRHVPYCTIIMSDFLTATALLRELASAAGMEVDNWRAKWLRVCELLWKAMSTSTDIPAAYETTFIRLLKDDDRFALARLVIPEFRTAEGLEMLTAQQAKVMEAISDLQLRTSQEQNTSQADFDDPVYAAEKRILLDAEMHRARVLLHQSYTLDDASEEEIRDWLERRPGNKRLHQTSIKTNPPDAGCSG